MVSQAYMNPWNTQQTAFQTNGSGATLTYQDLVNIVAKLAGQYPGFPQASLQGGQLPLNAMGMIQPDQWATIVNRIVQTTVPIVTSALQLHLQQQQGGQYPGLQGFQQPMVQQGVLAGSQFAQGGIGPAGIDQWATIVSRVVQTTVPIVLSALQLQLQQLSQYPTLQQPAMQQGMPFSGQFASGGIGTVPTGIPFGTGNYQAQPTANQFAFAR